MAQLDENTTFQSFWAALPYAPTENRVKVFQQFMLQAKRMALSSVIDALDGATDATKSYVWKEWVANADLSGANIYDILALKSEPPDAVAHIVKRWLTQVNLKNFSLKEMRVLTEDSAGMLTADDVQAFWVRWLISTDLRMVHLVDFAKAIRGLSPEIQLALINAYVEHSPNIATYGGRERMEARKHLSQWAVAQCSLFSGKSAGPKFHEGQLVTVYPPGNGSWHITSVYQQNGVYYYWLENGQSYYKESDLRAV